MIFKKTNLDKVLLITPEVFEDHRGEYIEIYNNDIYKNNGVSLNFVQDDISLSYKNVLRGIHSDKVSWKLVSCLLGKYYLVVVNCDSLSNEFGKWESFILSDVNRRQVLIPPNHGVAHLALSKKIIFHYKQTSYYNRSEQETFKFNDARFGVWWPIKQPILSRRDEEGHYVD